MTAKSGIDLNVDVRRNLLVVRFRGNVTAVAMKARFEELGALLRRTRPGFTVFTDLSELEAMELDCVASLTRMMELFKTAGVETVVRLIPDPEKDIGFNILSLTHYRRGVRIITCQTRAEAEQVLSAARPEVGKV